MVKDKDIMSKSLPIVRKKKHEVPQFNAKTCVLCEKGCNEDHSTYPAHIWTEMQILTLK